MSYELIRNRAANKAVVLNPNNQLDVKDFTGNGDIALADSPVFTGDAQANNLDMNGVLTLSADPVNDLEAATKQYVDAVATGLDLKASVRVATTANITLVNEQTIDGVVLSAGDRVLVKNQTNAEENGIYVVVDGGAWTRALDADNSPNGEVTSGMFTFVEEGTTNGSSGWVLATENPIILDTTELSFTKFSSAGAFTAGAGLVQNGSDFDVVGTANRITVNPDSIDIASTYVGQTSITTLGTITTGVWNGTLIGAVYGGTGFSSYTTGDLVYASGATTLSKLGIGGTGTFLTVSGGVPVWSTDSISETIDDRVATLIQDGTGLSWTYVDGSNTLTGNVSLASFDTDDLSEGSTNLYFTNTRARLALSGTTDRIDYNNTTGAIDIASTYVGQASLTTLGTIATGVWNATEIGVAYGGTGLTSTGTANQVLGVVNAGGSLEYKSILGTANRITVTHGANSITLSTPQDIHTGASPTFAGLTLSGLTADRALFIDGSNVLIAVAYTGTGNAVRSADPDFTGTVDVVNLLASGTVTLSADPTLALQAATKQYVDNLVSGVIDGTLTAGTIPLASDSNTLTNSVVTQVSGRILVSATDDTVNKLQVNGSFKSSGLVQSLSTKTDNHNAAITDFTLPIDATSKAVTVTLPASPVHGHVLNIKKIDSSSNNVIVDGNGNEIDGNASFTINSQYFNLQLQYDSVSTQWFIL